MSLPALVVLSVRDPNDEVRYLSFTGPKRQLRCGPEENVFSDTARFAVEPAGDGLVHIRSRYDNYYWARESISEAWLTASATEKVEDKSKDECTLFRPRISAGNTFVRFKHVQSGMNVVMLPADDALGYNLVLDYDAPTEFSVTDFRVLSSTKLPKYVMFLGDNNNYLSVDKSFTYLNFEEFDLPSSNTRTRVCFEIFYNKTGDKLRIRSRSAERFLRILPNKRVSLDSLPDFHPDTLFDAALSSPRGMSDKGIALRTLVLNQYCQRNLTSDFVAGTLSADSLNVWLRPNYLIWPNRNGNVSIVRFRKPWTGPKSIRELKTVSFSNPDIHEKEGTVPVKYQARKITTFTHTVTMISKGYQALFEGRMPDAVETGELEFSRWITYVQSSWGADKIDEWTTRNNVKIVTPPRSSVRATIFVNIVTYEVPFSYRQYDVSPIGGTAEHLHDGVLIHRSEEFLGVNYDIQPLTSQVLDKTIYTDLRTLELEGINAVDDGIEPKASHERIIVQDDRIEPNTFHEEINVHDKGIEPDASNEGINVETVTLSNQMHLLLLIKTSTERDACMRPSSCIHAILISLFNKH